MSCNALLARQVVRRLFVVCLLLGIAPALRSQDPFLELEFESDDDLVYFFNPTGLGAIDLCGEPYPSGDIRVDSGELLVTNDEFAGLTLFSMFPDEIDGLFPDSGNYRLLVRINLESVNELLVYVRGRGEADDTVPQFRADLERGYAFAVFPELSDAERPNGALAAAEFTSCHTTVPHDDWPNATDGFARIETPFPVVAGQWYWLEIGAQGDDDGGPVLLTARLWPDDDDPPETQMLSLVDPDGLDHTPQTLDPENAVEVIFGTSIDGDQQPGATCRLDDLMLTEITGCPEPAVTVQRELWEPRASVEGRQASLFEADAQYDVTLTIGSWREAGICDAAGRVTVVETVPAGWTITAAEADGAIDGTTVSWSLDPTGDPPTSLRYTVTAAGDSPVVLSGEVQEPGSDFVFPTGGELRAVPTASTAPISDFGSIQHWLILGQFTREVNGAAPGDAEIIRDYLTDGETTERDVRPEAGDTIEPDYGGAAASTGLADNLFDRNPGGVPTWIEWTDLDDADDRIDFDSIYGGFDEVMTYALAYLRVDEDVVLNFGVSSDDSVHVLLDGATLHANNRSRGALNRTYQDTPAEFPDLGGVLLTEGEHTLLVKVFDGGGEHNFRVGFLDEIGIEIPGGPPEVEISLTPLEIDDEPRFLRGDSDTRGSLELTDGIRTLNFLFTGGEVPACRDAADTDDNGRIELTDAVGTFLFLFSGGDAPPAPGPTDCGIDPTPDELDCLSFEGC